MPFKRSKYLHLYKIGNLGYILFHSLNQEIVIGNAKLKQVFCDSSMLSKLKRSDPTFFKFLTDKNFIVSSNRLENIFDIIKKPTNNESPYTLLRILLTDLCNLDCTYCKVQKNIKNVIQKSTSVKKIEKAIKIFFAGSDEAAPKVIHITGGEPLIFWDKVTEIVRFIDKYKRRKEKYFLVIGTNATLLNNERIGFIKSNNIKVIISLDGKKEHHDKLRVFNNKRGSYGIVDKMIKKLKMAGVEVGISMVIGKHNINALGPIIKDFIREYNPASLGVNFMKTPVENEHDFNFMITPEQYVSQVYSIYKKFRNYGLFMELPYRKLKPIIKKDFRYFDCGAASGTTINVDAKGNIGPCKTFLIMERVFLNQLKKEKIKQVLHTFRERTPINKESCQSCPAIAICGNGCAYSAFIDCGDSMGVDINACTYSKLFHKAILEDLFRLNLDKLKKSKLYHYIITLKDRKKLLGKIKVNQNTLSSSIGHET